MKTNRKTVQLSLIVLGCLIILITYFLYPNINKERFESNIVKDKLLETQENEINSFENVEYRGAYNAYNTFLVKSEKAYILTEEPNVVYMTNMRVSMFMKDGRIIIITSDKGKYNKITYDCFFENNVKSTDGETIISAENLDLIAVNETATIYNDVYLTNENGSLVADKIHYDLQTKLFKISMFGDKSVNIKYKAN